MLLWVKYFGENADLGDFLGEISRNITICSRREKLTVKGSTICVELLIFENLGNFFFRNQQNNIFRILVLFFRFYFWKINFFNIESKFENSFCIWFKFVPQKYHFRYFANFTVSIAKSSSDFSKDFSRFFTLILTFCNVNWCEKLWKLILKKNFEIFFFVIILVFNSNTVFLCLKIVLRLQCPS